MVRKWYSVSLYSKAFTTAYTLASSKAKEVLTEQAKQGRGAIVPRALAKKRAVSFTFVLMRLAATTPAIYQLLQRALGIWQSAIHMYEAREYKKEVSNGLERTRNLKKGWKDEQTSRIELEQRANKAESEVIELGKVLRTLQGEADEQRLLLMEYQEEERTVPAGWPPPADMSSLSDEPLPRPSCLPKPGTLMTTTRGGSSASYLPDPPQHLPRIKELEGRVREAREEAAKAMEEAKADKLRLHTLQKEHGPLVAEVKALRQKDFGVKQLNERIATLKARLADYPHERACLHIRRFAAAMRGDKSLRALKALHATSMASALARHKLKQAVTALQGGVKHNRWRRAMSLWRFLNRQRLSRGLSTWRATVLLLRLDVVYNDKLFEVERRGEVAAIAEDNEHDKALDKLRRAADAKLRKERDLATTRMLERDALARQVTQLQAQLRHKDALRHPSPGQDTNVPASRASKSAVDMRKASGRERKENTLPAGAPSSSAAGEGGGGDKASSSSSSARRAPVPKRPPVPTPSIHEEEAKELREALSASRAEKDVLQCEVHSMRLELETMRELMSS